MNPETEKFITEFKKRIEADGSFEIDEYGHTEPEPERPWCLLWCRSKDPSVEMDALLRESMKRISDVAGEIGGYELEFARLADDPYDIDAQWKECRGFMLDVVFGEITGE